MSDWADFDWRAYLRIYPEVGRREVGGKALSYLHWLRFGRYEGRCFPRLSPGAPWQSGVIERAVAEFSERALRIPLVVCLDVEPDEQMFPLEAPPAWDGFLATVEVFDQVRREVAESAGDPFRCNWFVRLDPQIKRGYGTADYPLRQFSDYWNDLRQQGDNVGLHVHGYRYQEKLSRWQRDYADPDWVAECIETGCSAFRDYFGQAPETHRFGDRWVSAAALARLSTLGIRYDLTLEPGIEGGVYEDPAGINRGRFPDMRRLPRHPHRFAQNPSAAESGAESAPELWQVPLSSGLVRATWPWPRRKMATLNLICDPRQFCATVLENLLRPQPYLAAIMRTEAMLNPYFAQVAKVNLRCLTRLAATGRFVFDGPAAVTGLSQEASD